MSEQVEQRMISGCSKELDEEIKHKCRYYIICNAPTRFKFYEVKAHTLEDLRSCIDGPGNKLRSNPNQTVCVYGGTGNVTTGRSWFVTVADSNEGPENIEQHPSHVYEIPPIHTKDKENCCLRLYADGNAYRLQDEDLTPWRILGLVVSYVKQQRARIKNAHIEGMLDMAALSAIRPKKFPPEKYRVPSKEDKDEPLEDFLQKLAPPNQGPYESDAEYKQRKRKWDEDYLYPYESNEYTRGEKKLPEGDIPAIDQRETQYKKK